MTAKWLFSVSTPLATSTPQKNDKTTTPGKPPRALRGGHDASRRALAPREAKRVQSFVQRGRGR